MPGATSSRLFFQCVIFGTGRAQGAEGGQEFRL